MSIGITKINTHSKVKMNGDSQDINFAMTRA